METEKRHQKKRRKSNQKIKKKKCHLQQYVKTKHLRNILRSICKPSMVKITKKF